MTFRAVVIGLVLGLVVAAVGYLNDWSLKLVYLANNLVPANIYGMLLLGLLVVNPLLRLARLRPLRGAEWAIVGLVYYLHTGVNGPVVRVHPF